MRKLSTLSLVTACVVMISCGGADDGARAELDSGGGDGGAAAVDAADTANGTAGSGMHDDSPGSSRGDEDTAAESGHGGHAAVPGEGVPLLAIMRKLGADVMTLTYALMSEDHEQVANSAHAIAEHSPIAAEDVERIHSELGGDMAEFERLDEAVHNASMRLHDAAVAGRMDQVLERLGEVQRGCMECHSRFRDRLRTTTAQ